MVDINIGEGEKKCTKCKTSHPINMFKLKNKNIPDKRCSWCKSCMNEYAKIHSRKLNYPVNVTEKICFECKVTKMCHDFPKCKKDTTGLSSYCKQCTRNKRLEFMKDVKNFLIMKRADAMKRCKKNKKNKFDISTDDWMTQYKKQRGMCAMSGIEMTWEYSADGESDFYTAVKYPFNISPDRIDSNKGYTKDNLQFVCNRINAMKNNMSTDQFIDFCKKIIDFHNMRES